MCKSHAVHIEIMWARQRMMLSAQTNLLH